MAIDQLIDESVYNFDAETERGERPREFALIIIKPMAMEKGLTPVIMQRLISEGQCVIESAKLGTETTKEKVAQHYAGSRFRDGKPTTYYPGLVHYISEKVVDIFVIADAASISDGRTFQQRLRQDLIGPSNPEKTEPHHIRSMARFMDYIREVDIPAEEDVPGSEDAIDNLVHCSDSTESALREIEVWFKENPEMVEQFREKHYQLQDEADDTLTKIG